MAESRGLRTQRFLRVLDQDEEFRTAVSARYPTETQLIARFRRQSGDQCTYVRAAVERIYYLEHDRVGTRFTQDIQGRLAAQASGPAK